MIDIGNAPHTGASNLPLWVYQPTSSDIVTHTWLFTQLSDVPS